MNKILVLIPAYNEARAIGKIVRDVRARGLEVYVVDDGSADTTAAIATENGALVIRNAKNMGKGAALREGFKHIMEKDFDAVILIDGDSQHEVSSIPAFTDEMDRGGADIVIGNRMGDTGSMPYVRQKTNLFMSYVISRMAGASIPDSQCGYRLIKKKVLGEVKFDSSNFEIESELIIKAARKGFKISSVPIKAVYQDEKSRINPVIDTFRFMAFVIKMSFIK